MPYLGPSMGGGGNTEKVKEYIEHETKHFDSLLSFLGLVAPLLFLDSFIGQLPAGRIDVLPRLRAHRYGHAFPGQVGGKAFSRSSPDLVKALPSMGLYSIMFTRTGKLRRQSCTSLAASSRPSLKRSKAMYS